MYCLQFVSLYFLIFWLLTFLEKEHNFKKEKISTELDYYPSVSVIIPAYNEEKTISKTIQSVLELDYPYEKLDIYVVNDGSKDRTLQKIKEMSSKNKNRKLNIISHDNMGKANSLNKVIDMIDTDFFVCLDADSFVDTLTLKKQISLYQQMNNNNVAVITPAMKVFNPKNFLQKVQRIEYIVAMFFARMMSRLNMIFVAPGPFSLYRTGIVKKVGGFDNNSLTEDQEIVFRLQDRHYQIKQCFNGYVYTVAPSSVKVLINQRRRWFKGGLLTLKKYKHLLFNKAYGDFGIMQLPFNLFAFGLSMFVLLFSSYFFFQPIFNHVRNLYLVGFDVLYYISTLTFDFNLLDLRFGMLFILYCAFALFVFVLVSSYRNAEEKIFSYGVLSLFVYFFFYNIFLSSVCFLVILETLVGVKQKW